MDIALQANAGSEKHRQILKGVLGIHESEWDWIGSEIDETIENNTSVEDLHTKILNLDLTQMSEFVQHQ